MSLCKLYSPLLGLHWDVWGTPPPQQGHNLLHPIKLSHQGTESSRSPCKRVLVPYRAPAPGGGPPLGGQGWGESLPWVLRGWRAVPLTVAHLCPVTARCYRRGGRRPRSGCVASETSPSGLTRRQAAPHLPEGTAPRGSPQGPAGQQRVVSSAAEPGAGKARAAGERLSSAAGLFPQQRGGAEAHLALSGKPQVLSFRFPRWRYSRLLTPSAPSRRELPSGAGTPLEGGAGGRWGRAARAGGNPRPFRHLQGVVGREGRGSRGLVGFQSGWGWDWRRPSVRPAAGLEEKCGGPGTPPSPVGKGAGLSVREKEVSMGQRKKACKPRVCLKKKRSPHLTTTQKHRDKKCEGRTTVLCGRNLFNRRVVMVLRLEGAFVLEQRCGGTRGARHGFPSAHST